MDKPKPIKLVCKRCGSENVRRDAWAEWDSKVQKEVLADVFSAGYCVACDGDASLAEVELTDVEITEIMSQPSPVLSLDDLPEDSAEILRTGIQRIIEACKLNGGATSPATGLSWEVAHKKLGAFAISILKSCEAAKQLQKVLCHDK